MTDNALFTRYMPVLMEDIHEPFEIKKVACTLFKDRVKSPTSGFFTELASPAVTALEYAFYWDYDIQHLYDLEHAFVFIDKEGTVTDLISSFHGRFYRQSSVTFKGNRPVLYIQPGKHALMAHPEYFRLFVDFEKSCNEKAGIDGVALPDFIGGVSFTPDDNTAVGRFIKDSFSFSPTGSYKEAKDPSGLITDPESLFSFIRSRVSSELDRIRSLKLLD